MVASVHSSMAMDSAAMTARIVRAISNPLVDVIGHLSGRKIERRPPYRFDFPAIIEAARETGTLLEINSSPDRRDMNEVHARAAAEAGIPIVINCDAHRVGGFEVARYGVATARRAWLGPDAVLNTRPWDEVAALRSEGPRFELTLLWGSCCFSDAGEPQLRAIEGGPGALRWVPPGGCGRFCSYLLHYRPQPR